MSENEQSQSEGFDIYPQVKQHPTTFVVGSEIVDVVTSAQIDSDVEDTGSGFAVIWRDPTVVGGSLWKQRDIPEGYDSAAEFNNDLKIALAGDGDWVGGVEVDQKDIDAARDRVDAGLDGGFDADEDTYTDLNLGVDYKIANEDDRDFTAHEMGGEVLGIDVGGSMYASEKVDEFEEDEVMVWYGGITGQFIARALDFNGMPSTRYKDDGYLVKGLFQHPLGWFDYDADNYDVSTTDRGKLARATQNGGLGRPPRFARPPVLRPDIEGESMFIKIGRYNDGNMYEVTIGYNDFEDDPDEATELDLRYDQEPEPILEEEFDVDDATEVYSLYHGEGWQPEPDNAGGGEPEDTSGASFDVDVADDGDDDEEVEQSGPTEDETQFGRMIAEKISGSGATPDDPIFTVDGENADLAALVAANEPEFGSEPNVDAIRAVVYENTAHLSEDDL